MRLVAHRAAGESVPASPRTRAANAGSESTDWFDADNWTAGIIFQTSRVLLSDGINYHYKSLFNPPAGAIVNGCHAHLARSRADRTGRHHIAISFAFSCTSQPMAWRALRAVSR